MTGSGRSATSTSSSPVTTGAWSPRSARCRNTRDGDDALELAADGLLGASIGFAVLHPDDEEWSVDRRSRRVTKAWLDHIALTGDPAYPGAKVLAVAHRRPSPSRRSATPNLDEVLAWLLAERYSHTQP